MTKKQLCMISDCEDLYFAFVCGMLIVIGVILLILCIVMIIEVIL